MKILIAFAGIILLTGFTYLYIVNPLMAWVIFGLIFVLVVVFASLYAWALVDLKLGQARLVNAQAFATTIEAAKIHETNQAVMLPAKLAKTNIVLLPGRQSQRAIATPNVNLLEPSPVDELPTAPSFGEILRTGWQPSLQQMLLGYSHDGPIYGDIAALLSTAVAGRPGQGKSSLLRLVAAQMYLTQGVCVSLDPHGSIAEDVPGLVYREASTAAELDDMANWLVNRLEIRLKAYRQGERRFRPLMALTDEFPIVSLASREAVEAIGRVVLEGRKVRMFCLISGQGLPASQFGGSLVRDALSSRYIFQTTARQGQMAGLDKEAIKLLDRLDIGRCVLDGPVKPQIIAVPYVNNQDLRLITASKPQEAAGQAEQPARAYQSPPQPAQDVVEGQYRELPSPNANPKLIRAYREVVENGNNSVDKLAKALGCSTSTASQLLQVLEEKGYYKRPIRKVRKKGSE